MNQISHWTYGNDGYYFITIRINETFYSYKAELGVIQEVMYLFDKHRHNDNARWKVFHAYKSVFSQKNLIHDTYIPPTDEERERIVSGLYELIENLKRKKNA